MPRLQVLGGLSFESAAPEATSLANQRRRLALLAVIACAEDGVSRDALVGLLWPESAESRAKNALKQALFGLRRALPDGALDGTNVVRLNRERVSVDRSDFLKALSRQDFATAVALYRGPFLDGFYLDGAPEFERWVEAERDPLARRYRDSLETLARGAGMRGDVADAIHWWRRRVEAGPLDSGPVIELMRGLARAGDAPAALKVARVHEQLVLAELDAPADPAVLRYAAELRSPSPVRSSRAVPERARAAAETAAPAAAAMLVERSQPLGTYMPLDVDGALASETRHPGVPQQKGWRTPLPARAGGLATAAMLALAAVGALRYVVAGNGDSASAEQRVAILPFSVRGADPYLGVGMAELLAMPLHGAGRIRTVDPRSLIGYLESRAEAELTPEEAAAVARHFGARHFVLGSVIGAGDRLRVQATFYDVASGRARLRTRAEGTSDGLFQLTDRLAAELVTPLFGPGRDRLARSAGATTASFPAYRKYLEGEALFRAARYAEAAGAFAEAVRLDTTFALAYYRLSIAADWGVWGGVGRREAADQALKHSDRLSPYERLLLQGLLAWWRGAGDEAEGFFRRAVAERPTDVEAWYQLGEVLFHLNPDRGRDFREARAALERVLELDPANREARRHLLRIAAAERDAREVQRLADDLSPAEDPLERFDLEGMRAFLAGTARERSNLLARTAEMDAYTAWVLAWRLAAFGGDLEGAAAVASASLEAHGAETVTTPPAFTLAYLELARGRPHSMLDALRRAEPRAARRFAAEAESMLLTHPLLPAQLRRRLLSELAAIAPPGDTLACELVGNLGVCSAPAYARGLRAIAAGRVEEANRIAQQLAADATHHRQSAAAQSLRARAALAAGSPAAALTLLPVPNHSDSDFYDVIDRFTRAEALTAMGRLDEAVAWYGTIEGTSLQAMAFAAPARYRRAELLSALGRAEAAGAEYARAADYWRAAEPALTAVLAPPQAKDGRFTRGARRFGTAARSAALSSGLFPPGR